MGRVGAWVLIAGLALLTAGGLLFHAASFLKLAYPLAALVVGTALFSRSPGLYVGLVWWLWFLTPLVRRLVDYQVGWDSTNPVLLAPALVTGISALTVVRRLRTFGRTAVAPFALVLAGLLYAYPVGIYRAGTSAATYSLLVWAAPVCFGFHLALQSQQYAALRQASRRAFAAGVLVIGLYGLWQYFAPPAWDQYWMVHSGMGSIGLPEPRLVRVFSTLNSPPPCAAILGAGLLTLITAGSLMQWIAGVPGYVTFALTLVRTAWLAWLIGLFTYWIYATARARVRVVAATGILLLLLLPFIRTDLYETLIVSRFQTLQATAQDESARSRMALYSRFAERLSHNPVGDGLGSTGGGGQLNVQGSHENLDSGFIDVFESLGWFGAALFLGGALLLLAAITRARERKDDQFAKVTRGIAISLFLSMLSFNSLTGVVGAVFWGFVGIQIAGRGPRRLDPTVRGANPPGLVGPSPQVQRSHSGAPARGA
jgi:O-Antigen ligase